VDGNTIANSRAVGILFVGEPTSQDGGHNVFRNNEVNEEAR
jgi:hypothetical protein